jgi:hypothetical protein
VYNEVSITSTYLLPLRTSAETVIVSSTDGFDGKIVGIEMDGP